MISSYDYYGRDLGMDLKKGDYTVVGCDGVINENGLGQLAGGKVTVDAQSALIMYNK